MSSDDDSFHFRLIQVYVELYVKKKICFLFQRNRPQRILMKALRKYMIYKHIL